MDHAQDAKAAGFHIEAIQTLHGWVEVKIRELLLSLRAEAVGIDKHWGRIWDMTNQISLYNATNALFIAGVLSERQVARILDFNRIRNNVIHKLFHDPYEKEYRGVPVKEYSAAFRAGNKLGWELQTLVEERFETSRSNNAFKRRRAKRARP
jgi:hypothetical protein